MKDDLARLKVLRPPLPWDKPRRVDGEGDWVLLLHGLWRSVGAMEPLARGLRERGYGTVNFPYASMWWRLETAAARVRRWVEEELAPGEDGRKVHLVTHSLGGIVTRKLIEEERPSWLGRVVMLAPPNQGSEIVDWLGPLGRWTLGPVSRNLRTAAGDARPPLPEGAEVGVVMGSKSQIPFFRRLLEADNDGIVSVERGRLDGMKDFLVLDADHTFMMGDAGVLEAVAGFLEKGRF